MKRKLRRSGLPWAPSDDVLLEELYPKLEHKKISVKNLEEKFGRTWQAIYGRATRLKLKRNIIDTKNLSEGVIIKCHRCGFEATTEKELKLFTKSNGSYRNLCKKCSYKNRRKREKEKPFHHYWLHKKHKCIELNESFHLTEEFLENLWNKQKGVCALSSVKMFKPYYNDKDNFDTNPSLDRIDPNKDYSEDNVRWVINCINTFKGRLTDRELYKLAKGIVDTYESSNSS